MSSSVSMKINIILISHENITYVILCTCRLDSSGAPLLNAGYEFSLSVRGSVPGDTSLAQAENVVITAVREAIDALIAGKLV